MVASKVLVAKRALVKILLALAAAYSVVLKVNRDTSDADVIKAYRRVSLKAHPDKSQKAQTTAKNIALRFKNACRCVVKGGGVAIKG